MNEKQILIPECVKKQIDYLHLEYPNKEWSGMLAYTVKKLDLGGEVSIKVEGIFPMDLGRASYTEFEYENKIAEVYDIFEKGGITIEDLKVGLIHSHHNMKSYFSGTDTGEIATNAKKHNYYLSLVVSTDEEYAARLAFPSQVDVVETHTILNTKGETVSIPKSYKKESLITIDLVPVIEQDIALDSWFKDRITELKEVPTTPVYGFGGGRSWGKESWEKKPSEGYYKNPWGSTKPPLLPAKDTKKEGSTAEAFLLDLAEILYGVKFVSVRALVRKCLTSPNIGGMYIGFDTAFNRLYIKHFGSKPATEDELDDLLSEIIILIDVEEGELLETLPVTEEDNLLESLKDQFYGQITE